MRDSGKLFCLQALRVAFDSRSQFGALLGVLLDIDAQGAGLCACAIVNVDDIESVRGGDALRGGANLVQIQGHGQSMRARFD